MSSTKGILCSIVILNGGTNTMKHIPKGKNAEVTFENKAESGLAGIQHKLAVKLQQAPQQLQEHCLALIAVWVAAFLQFQ